MRRTLPLAALAAFGVLLVLCVRPAAVPRGRDAARGHRLFNADARSVRGVALELHGRHVASTRGARGWSVDGRPASSRILMRFF